MHTYSKRQVSEMAKDTEAVVRMKARGRRCNFTCALMGIVGHTHLHFLELLFVFGQSAVAGAELVLQEPVLFAELLGIGERRLQFGDPRRLLLDGDPQPRLM